MSSDELHELADKLEQERDAWKHEAHGRVDIQRDMQEEINQLVVERDKWKELAETNAEEIYALRPKARRLEHALAVVHELEAERDAANEALETMRQQTVEKNAQLDRLHFIEKTIARRRAWAMSLSEGDPTAYVLRECADELEVRVSRNRA